MNDGDWVCSDSNCGNINFVRRTVCYRCNKEKPDSIKVKQKKLGTEIGKSAAEKSRGLFNADDWQCNKCANVNWARRQTCNVCNAPKFGEVEARTGYGGGYNERGTVEYRRREPSSDDEFDEFGRRKKKRVSDSLTDNVGVTGGPVYENVPPTIPLKEKPLKHGMKRPLQDMNTHKNTNNSLSDGSNGEVAQITMNNLYGYGRPYQNPCYSYSEKNNTLNNNELVQPQPVRNPYVSYGTSPNSRNPVMENSVSSTNEAVNKFRELKQPENQEVSYSVEEKVLIAAYAIVYNNCKKSASRYETKYVKKPPDFKTIFAWRQRLLSTGCLSDSHVVNIQKPVENLQNTSPKLGQVNSYNIKMPQEKNLKILKTIVPNPDEIIIDLDTDSDREVPTNKESPYERLNGISNSPNIEKQKFNIPNIYKRPQSITKSILPSKANHTDGNKAPISGSDSDVESISSDEQTDYFTNYGKPKRKRRRRSITSRNNSKGTCKTPTNELQLPAQPASPTYKLMNSYEMSINEKPHVSFTHIPVQKYSTSKSEQSPLVTGNIYAPNRLLGPKKPAEPTTDNTDACSAEYVPTKIGGNSKRNYQQFKNNVIKKGYWAKGNGLSLNKSIEQLNVNSLNNPILLKNPFRDPRITKHNNDISLSQILPQPKVNGDDYIPLNEVLASKSIQNFSPSKILPQPKVNKTNYNELNKLVDLNPVNNSNNSFSKIFPQPKVNGDNYISLNEVVASNPVRNNDNSFSNIFPQTKLNGDNYISLNEVVASNPVHNDNSFSNIFSQAKVNGDNNIPLNEVVASNSVHNNDSSFSKIFPQAKVNGDNNFPLNEVVASNLAHNVNNINVFDIAQSNHNENRSITDIFNCNQEAAEESPINKTIEKPQFHQIQQEQWDEEDEALYRNDEDAINPLPENNNTINSSFGSTNDDCNGNVYKEKKDQLLDMFTRLQKPDQDNDLLYKSFLSSDNDNLLPHERDMRSSNSSGMSTSPINERAQMMQNFANSTDNECLYGQPRAINDSKGPVHILSNIQLNPPCNSYTPTKMVVPPLNLADFENTNQRESPSHPIEIGNVIPKFQRIPLDIPDELSKEIINIASPEKKIESHQNNAINSTLGLPVSQNAPKVNSGDDNCTVQTEAVQIKEAPAPDLTKLLKGIDTNTLLLALQNLGQQSQLTTANNNVKSAAEDEHDNGNSTGSDKVEVINLTNDDWEKESDCEESIEQRLERLDGNTGDTPFLGEFFDSNTENTPARLKSLIDDKNKENTEVNKITTDDAPVAFKSFALPKPIMLNRLKLRIPNSQEKKAKKRKQSKKSREDGGNDDDDEDESDDNADLSKYDLWGSDDESNTNKDGNNSHKDGESSKDGREQRSGGANDEKTNSRSRSSSSCSSSSSSSSSSQSSTPETNKFDDFDLNSEPAQESQPHQKSRSRSPHARPATTARRKSHDSRSGGTVRDQQERRDRERRDRSRGERKQRRYSREGNNFYSPKGKLR